MPPKKIAIAYFSATHVTKTYAGVIAQAFTDLGCETTTLNLTPHAARQTPFPIADHDAFIFGFPVFSDFAPSVINDWLPTLNGQGKRCGVFLTYGARTTGYAHFHTAQLLEEAGFHVMLSAEFLGRHTFNVAGWTVLPERPDETDFSVAQTYASEALNRFTQAEMPLFKLQKPFGYNQALDSRQKKQPPAERGWTHPVRTVETCSMCRDCETECPTEAFDADTGLSDPATCIECMHCLYICPDRVIKIDTRMKDAYEGFKKSWHLTEPMMEAKQSKIITESWHAAS